MFGGAIGALIIGNPGHAIKGAFSAIKKSFGSPRWNEQDFQDILCLLFTITQMIKSPAFSKTMAIFSCLFLFTTIAWTAWSHCPQASPNP